MTTSLPKNATSAKNHLSATLSLIHCLSGNNITWGKATNAATTRKKKKDPEICLKKPEQASEQQQCRYCALPLLQTNFRDAVRDHCHITGQYRGAAHNACNFKLQIKPKKVQIPVVFRNLRGYDAHLLMQGMSKVKKEIRCVANNMEKYVTFSVGGLRFIDSLNFLLSSLDSLVKATP